MSDTLRVKAPGKLYIAGEYAVVEPGHAAILVAVNRYITVTLEETENTGRVHSEGTGFSTIYWRHHDNRPVFSDMNGDYVSHAISTVEQLRAERGLAARHYNLEITSDLADADGRKFGLGSSAAVTVAIVDALNRFYQLGLTDLQRYQLGLLAVTRRAPAASGGDVAASTYGGWLLYRSPDRAALEEARGYLSMTDLLHHSGWDPLEITPLPGPSAERLLVGWTGSPASTEHLVSGVQSRSRGRYFPGFLTASDAAVMTLAEALRAGKHVDAAVRRARGLLRRLARASGIRIETPLLERLGNIVEELGGAAKSSGAGGGDCGIAVINEDTDLDAVYRQWQNEGIIPLDLTVTVRPDWK